jgi:hypothetical protein
MRLETSCCLDRGVQENSELTVSVGGHEKR